MRALELSGTLDVVDRHFAAENAHDVAATLATYADDIVWDDVTHPLSPVSGKEAVGAVYTDILHAIPDVKLETVRRIQDGSGTVVVDVSILTGHVDGMWAGIEGGGAPVRVRILHVFDLRDGLITRENAWFDSADVMRQVVAWKERRAGAPTPSAARVTGDPPDAGTGVPEPPCRRHVAAAEGGCAETRPCVRSVRRVPMARPG